MSDKKQKDVTTAANIIADKYLADLKIQDIKKAMVSAMLEYADLRSVKSENKYYVKNL